MDPALWNILSWLAVGIGIIFVVLIVKNSRKHEQSKNGASYQVRR